MKYITAYLPIYASAKFKMKKPDNWDDLDKADQVDMFLFHAKKDAGLCYQCVENIQTDFMLDSDMCDDDDIDFEEV